MMEAPRLRQRPADRFAGTEHVFELAAIAERLRHEPHPATDGHRQMTIFHDGPVSLVLFDFDRDSRLVDHVAEGLVTIHVVAGRIAVRTRDGSHELATGSLLVLAPGVAHDLHAAEPSQVLVTVHLESNDRERSAPDAAGPTHTRGTGRADTEPSTRA